ncbi:hypothetical protein cypCar_00002752 [Cyprinus carpio]|nr:hypothetical protein cypCar_00002752 [Cyprinus carpio]
MCMCVTLEGSGPVVHERRSQTLPVSRSRTGVLHVRLQQLNSLDNSYTYNHTYSHSDADVLNQSLLEGNIATEVCLTVLDTLSIFIMGFKTQLSLDHGHNPLMKKVFQVHLCFLQINQSETALRQVFTSLRTFIYKFPNALAAMRGKPAARFNSARVESPMLSCLLRRKVDVLRIEGGILADDSPPQSPRYEEL